MDDPIYMRLREQSWRRELTEAEEAKMRAYLADHPEARADWEVEAALSQVLNHLPDAPLASNFTARVLQAVQWESARPTHTHEAWRSKFWWWSLGWMRKAAVVVLVLGLGLVSLHGYQRAQRAKLVARSIATVSGVITVSSPENLEDFDAIQRLSQTPPADKELLALLQ